MSAVEYNAEQGLLTVSGDVNPTTLLHKLTKWGKEAELVSYHGDSSAHVPRTPEQSQNKTMEKKKRPTKCCLLMCFGKRSKNTKVEPMAIPNWNHPGVGSENGSATPLINVLPPPMVYPPPQAMPGFTTHIPYPPPQAMPGFTTPIPYPPPQFGAGQPPPYTAGMFGSGPPQSPPCFQLRQTEFPHMINSRLHYPHH